MLGHRSFCSHFLWLLQLTAKNKRYHILVLSRRYETTRPSGVSVVGLFLGPSFMNLRVKIPTLPQYLCLGDSFEGPLLSCGYKSVI